MYLCVLMYNVGVKSGPLGLIVTVGLIEGHLHRQHLDIGLQSSKSRCYSVHPETDPGCAVNTWHVHEAGYLPSISYGEPMLI